MRLQSVDEISFGVGAPLLQLRATIIDCIYIPCIRRISQVSSLSQRRQPSTHLHRHSIDVLSAPAHKILSQAVVQQK